MNDPEGKWSSDKGWSLNAAWRSACEGCLEYDASVNRQRSVNISLFTRAADSETLSFWKVLVLMA
jgi:hypothetical protein